MGKSESRARPLRTAWGILPPRRSVQPVTRKPAIESRLSCLRGARTNRSVPFDRLLSTFALNNAVSINLFAYDFLWVGELCLVERSGYCDLLRLPLTPDSLPKQNIYIYMFLLSRSEKNGYNWAKDLFFNKQVFVPFFFLKNLKCKATFGTVAITLFFFFYQVKCKVTFGTVAISLRFNLG